MGRFEFQNVFISNSHFKNGFYYYNDNEFSNGYFNALNVEFVNNTSEYGTFLNIPYIIESTANFIIIDSSKFINNTASKFGGVIYSLGPYNSKHLYISNCEFYNNNAKLGKNIYSYSTYSSATMQNSYINIEDIVSLPTKFEIDTDSLEEDKVSILSGEKIPEGISCK